MQGFRRRRRPRRPSSDESERGFVLIAAVWLLILAGAITAVLMLRSLASATAAVEHEEGIERKLALESAVETMLADRLFNGPRSPWWMTPVQGKVPMDGRDVSIRITSESGRLDVNVADPALIDSALRGFGVGAAERGSIVGRLQALRARKKRIGSLAELDNLVAGASRSTRTCLTDHLTHVSGLAEPRADQISSVLARALSGRGGTAGDDRPGVPEGGAALRVEASEAQGARMTAIVRLTGLLDRPVETSAWSMAPLCGGLRQF